MTTKETNAAKLLGRKLLGGNMPKQFKVGDSVMCNGYLGSISKVCDGQLTGMVEVRMPRGLVCVSADDAGLYRVEGYSAKESFCKHGKSLYSRFDCIACFEEISHE